jgi:hypothetical protein
MPLTVFEKNFSAPLGVLDGGYIDSSDANAKPAAVDHRSFSSSPDVPGYEGRWFRDRHIFRPGEPRLLTIAVATE